MANTQIFTGQINPNLTLPNKERNLIQNRSTQIFQPTSERVLTTAQTASILLLDVSGSTIDIIGNGDMRTKIDGIKESSNLFVAGLPPTAWVSIITFTDFQTTLFPLAPVENNKLNMISAVQKIQSGGGTNLVPALQAAKQELQKSPNGYMNRLYILTDGMFSDDAELLCNELKALGVQIFTVGFGESRQTLDEELLKRIASVSATGSPLYTYCDSVNKLSAFMRRNSKTITH